MSGRCKNPDRRLEAVPELPQVETIARDLTARIVGARATAVWGSGFPLRLARAVDLAALRRVASSRRIAGVTRKAKYLLVAFERGDKPQGPSRPGVLIHLGMSGRLLVEAATTTTPHTHIAFASAMGASCVFAIRAALAGSRRAPLTGVPSWGARPRSLSELDVSGLSSGCAGARADQGFYSIRAVAGWATSTSARRCIGPAFTRHAGGATRGRARGCWPPSARRWSSESRIGNTLRDYVDSFGPRNNAAALRVYGREGNPVRPAAPRFVAASTPRVDVLLCGLPAPLTGWVSRASGRARAPAVSSSSRRAWAHGASPRSMNSAVAGVKRRRS